MRHLRRSKQRLLGLALGLSLVTSAAGASAQYRLKGDVYAFGAAPSPVGLFVLGGQAKPTDWADAEAVVWMGTGYASMDVNKSTITTSGNETVGDVLVANIRLREPHGYGELRLGRMLLTAGAIRPFQLDGANALGRIPHGPTIQVFGGVPVLPGFAAQSYDWAAGGRVAQRVGEYVSAGVAYLQRRSEGRIAFEELGFDATTTPVKWLDAAGEVAVDLLHSDVSSARASVAARLGPARIEAYFIRRTPSHILPATSLFAAIGDVPSTLGGLSFSLRAAPRLDVWASGSADSIGGELGGRASLNATLRLDDRGDAAVGFELRRQWAPLGGWTGARGMARIPIVYRLRASAELEIVLPDDPGSADEPSYRGNAWPWGLVSLNYSPSFAQWLDLAGGVEASSSPTRLASVAGVFRASATWEKKR